MYKNKRPVPVLHRQVHVWSTSEAGLNNLKHKLDQAATARHSQVINLDEEEEEEELIQHIPKQIEFAEGQSLESLG